MTKDPMNKFIYLSSWDQLNWYIDPDQYKFYRCEFPKSNRNEFRNWIETAAEDTVYCWNGVSTPAPGSEKWTYITPNELYHWIIFESKDDENMFCLKYPDVINAVHSTGHRAWHFSRSL